MDIFDEIGGGDIFDQVAPSKTQPPIEDRTGITQTARENPNLYGAYGAGKALVSQAVKPTLETVGAIAGAPAGAIVGSSLGYGMGKKVGEMAERGYSALGEWLGLEQPSKEQPKSLSRSALEETGKSALDVGGAMALGKGMDIAGKALYPLESKIGQTVREAFQKAVKPTVAGKGNAAQVENYFAGAERAVKSIIKNPDVDLPKDMESFSKAIKDTKVSIYGQYNDIARQAGKEGIQVDLGATINEMRAIGNSPKLRRVNPSEGDKLLAMAEEWEKHPTKISPEEAENLISELNTLSKSWWKNPNPNDVHSAINYERIARNVREALTQSIGAQEGAEYNSLKKAYGDLTSIEKEVTNRAIVYGRRNPHGFFDLANIHGTAEFVYGLANMNPAAIAAGAATKGAVKYYKWVDSPDHRIKSMFETVQDKMVKAGEIPPPTEKNPFFLRGGKPQDFVGENLNTD